MIFGKSHAKMAHGHGLMSLPNFQYFKLHCSDMKAIKLLNDQDVLVFTIEHVLNGIEILVHLGILLKTFLGLLVYGSQLEASPSSSLIRTRMLLLRGILVS